MALRKSNAVPSRGTGTASERRWASSIRARVAPTVSSIHYPPYPPLSFHRSRAFHGWFLSYSSYLFISFLRKKEEWRVWKVWRVWRGLNLVGNTLFPADLPTLHYPPLAPLLHFIVPLHRTPIMNPGLAKIG